MTDMEKPGSLGILERLVAFDTTSANSNLGLMTYVQGYLRENDVASRLLFDEGKTKANLFATIGPRARGGVLLSGHTDTVPAREQEWTRAPYCLTEEDGRYYGRGTADMKAFIAAVLAAVPRMQAAKLHTPIHLALSYDEEIGCVGVRHLVDTLRNLEDKPAFCIVGEPTGMQVVTRHKGKLGVCVTVTGKECHSAMAPLGVNAIHYAARLIAWLEQLAAEKQRQGPFETGYDIPYTTVHTGIIEGGASLNTVPGYCRFLFEVRNVAGDDPRSLLQRFRACADELAAAMRRLDENCRITLDIVVEYPGLATADDADVVHFVGELAGHGATGSVSFGTEGGLFSALGIPTVVCGPGSMEQGHKADEYIHVGQIERCEAFLARLIDALGDRAVVGPRGNAANTTRGPYAHE